MPTTYSHALELNSVLDGVNMGSATAIDNLSAFTLGFLMRFNGAGAPRMMSKHASGGTSGWNLALQGSGRIDVTAGRATTDATATYNGAVTTDAAWRWVWVTYDFARGTNLWAIRSGAYGGSLSNVTASGPVLGSGAQDDDSGQNLVLGTDGIGVSSTVSAFALFAIFNSALSDGTIDSYSADFEAAGAAASLDYIKWDASMGSAATSAKSILTGTYGSTPSLVTGPGGASAVVHRVYY